MKFDNYFFLTLFTKIKKTKKDKDKDKIQI